MIFQLGKNDAETIVNMLALALSQNISFGVLLPDQKLKIDTLRQRYGGSNHWISETLRSAKIGSSDCWMLCYYVMWTKP